MIELNALYSGGAFTVLDQFGIIHASGADARAFLHNQLTNDIQHLDNTDARVAGLCSQQGRLLATFLIWRHAENIQLMLSSDIQSAVQKRLSMFILRSKVKLEDATPTTALIGIIGEVENALSPLFPTLPKTIHGKVDSDAGTLIRLPSLPNFLNLPNTLSDPTSAVSDTSNPASAQAQARYLWVTSQTNFQSKLGWLKDKLTRVTPTLWDWLDIHAGEPRITAATQGQFVPQMVNFEVIGGVNFRKGCYPGQEVVARLQYRGVVRRRTFLAHTDDAQTAQPGTEVFHSEDSAQPCGQMVNTAPAPTGGMDCLVQLKLAALNSGTIHLGTLNGPVLKMMPLPYDL